MNLKIKKIISEHSPAKCDENIEKFRSSSHHTREICFVVKGKSRYMINNRVFTARPGTVFLLNHWVTHTFGYQQEDSDLLHLWIFLGKKLRAALVSVTEKGDFFYTASVDLPQHLKDDLMSSWDELDRLDEITPDIVTEYLQSDLENFFSEINLLLKKNAGDATRARNENVIESIKNYINMTNSRDCSLAELEKISGYNRFYLSHCFKKYEKCTVREYINKVRIEYVAEAMKKGITQKEIAFELGYSSAANFWIWLNKYRKDIDEHLQQ